MHMLNTDHEPVLTHALECQVRAIKQEHYLLGRTLTTDEALAILDRRNAPRAVKPIPPEPVMEPEVFPYRRDLALAEARLIRLGYSDEQCDLIINDLRRTGSAWACEHFDDSSVYEHAVEIEAILEQHADWNSPRWDNIFIGAKD